MNKLIPLITIVLLSFSCKKAPITTTPTSTEFSNGILCLNEGLFQQNNASLSFYNKASKKVDQSIFKTVNGRDLGDTGNDMIQYAYKGEKYLAIVVNVSSQVEILKLSTLESVKQISMFNSNNESRSPRTLAVYNDLLYVVNFDGTVIAISLEDYSIAATITVGNNPDDNLLINDELWVVNTGGLNYPNYDSTVSVIDLNSNTVESTIDIGINPGKIIKDQNDYVYIISRGNYGSIKPKLVKVNSNTKAREANYQIPITQMTYLQNYIYYYDESQQTIKLFNTTTQQIEPNFLIDCYDFETFYQIHIDPYNQEIYLSDANGYVNMSTIRKYDNLGNFISEFNTGLITSKLIFTP